MIIVVICVLTLIVQYQIRPRFIPEDRVTLNFSKGTFINCLSNPTEDVKINSVGLAGIYVTALSSNLDMAFSMREWAAGCDTVGIIHNVDVPKNFYIPFSAIGSIQLKGQRLWSNPIAT